MRSSSRCGHRRPRRSAASSDGPRPTCREPRTRLRTDLPTRRSTGWPPVVRRASPGPAGWVTEGAARRSPPAWRHAPRNPASEVSAAAHQTGRGAPRHDRGLAERRAADRGAYVASRATIAGWPSAAQRTGALTWRPAPQDRACRSSGRRIRALSWRHAPRPTLRAAGFGPVEPERGVTRRAPRDQREPRRIKRVARGSDAADRVQSASQRGGRMVARLPGNRQA